MTPQEATREQLEQAIDDILHAMYSCQQCHRMTQDDTTAAANSAADGIALIDDALRNQNLVPETVEGHGVGCD